MTRHCHRLLVSLLVISLSAVTACGGKSPTGPTPVEPGGTPAPAAPAPAPVPAPAPAPQGSATISGQVVDSAAALDASPLAAGVPGVTVTVVGTSLTATADGNGRFTLSNVPSGDQQLSFSGGGTDATLRVTGIAERERIEITIAVSGRSAAVVGQERVNGAESEVEGRVTAVNDGARTIQVGAVTVSVPPGTVIRNATRSLTFANLKVNDLVHVRGARSGSTVTATEVTVRQSDDNAGGGQTEETVRGPIASVSGACPGKRLSVNGKTVQLSGDTQYLLGATCGALAAGVIVEAEGLASGSSVTARTLKIEDGAGGGNGNDGVDVSVTGAVAGLGGACPNRTFTLGPRTIVLSSATQYLLGATCAALANGATVEVEGHASGSTLTAKTLKFDDGPAGDSVVRGVVSGKGGSCPAITFTVQGRTVVTSSGTEFRKLTCEQVIDGTPVEAEGTLSGSTLTAKKVQLDN